MDPSYEGHGDYARVIATLRDALPRFAEGVYMVWYPQVQKVEASAAAEAAAGARAQGLAACPADGAAPDSQGFGLAGSGVFVINPPFTLHDELADVLPWLVEALGQYDGASYLLEQRPS